MVATSQPLAAQAGLRILQAGGNAVDAAIATIAAMCVVEPCSTGIGGDAFALIWQADRTEIVWAQCQRPGAARLTAEKVRALGHSTFPALGGLSVTVPGSVRGWQAALDRFGSMGLDSLLADAIDYARGGFPVSELIARSWAKSAAKMSVHPDSQRVWVPDGRTPGPGALFRNPEFARTLETLANEGVDAFYHRRYRPPNRRLRPGRRRLLTTDDLAAYQPEWVEPISIDYGRGFTFHEIPPNGQGLTALIALNIAKQFDLPALGYGSVDYYHALIEAMKLAFADAQAYIADPAPGTGAAARAAQHSLRAGAIRPDRPADGAHPTPGDPNQHGDTVYLTVADGAGNMVSWIQSLYMGFGSGLTAGTTGVQLQNRGANFSLEAGHPNEAAPGKRPYHTIIPGFITRNGQAWSSFGVMGGFMQPQGHLQVGLNLVEFGMSPQAALDAPRFQWVQDKVVGVETAVPAQIRAELARRDHLLQPADQPLAYGGGQVIVRDPETGVLIAGSEPRKDGAAVGW
jgi:gamma-glutamyltranspeptidase/glutathione hydrolase